MSTGALEPRKAAEKTLETGVHHLEEDVQLTFLKNIYGALLVSAGGLLSLILVTGSPKLSESSPGISHLLQGLAFPIGLVMVYLVGAELYTGYPMW
jgi:formate/nitrite transporter FocA (FNT family)